MNDSDPIVTLRPRQGSPATAARSDKGASAGPATAFDRHELAAILSVYGRRVAEGEWRDYAIDHSRDRAVFSIFRRASEVPLYRIVKQPKLRARQGPYSIVTQTGKILRRGHDIRQVLKAIDKWPKLVVA
ncbi:DUF2794 domain-containing protein [Kaustia mangrovi]|uniref:DUF2794 domain-containing protein n=1 Tax=Kaustia mangrovi TaxID=2593653 RepID=A0A7S8C2U1_9HYPH|nr:DUF2794 domain-containing protein [Kaustia mangrovi]QPC42302.1 DUF2794 domain-containing protein [Kaustia mangrovi]